MKKSVYLFLWFALTLAWSTGVYAQSTNVVVIVPDDLSYSDFSYYNRHQDAPRTPNIDRLIDESLRLTDFHVAPTCSPSRAQLMTGRYNDACGVWHTVMGRYFLDSTEVTMADVFKENGYRTAIFGKWHLGDSYPFRPQDHGFEEVVMIYGGGVDQQPNSWGSRNTMPSTVYDNGEPVVMTDANGGMPGAKEQLGVPGAFLTNFFTTKAIDYMKIHQEKQNPFFVYLAYNVAHVPNDTPPEARADASPHTATIENMDENIGRLLDFLDDSGLRDNTLLVFMLGDNGMANFMLRGDKATSYEAGHRVPCIIRWPAGGYAGTKTTSRDIPQMISEMDLLPTFMDVLNLKDVDSRLARKKMDGHSVSTLLDSDPSNNDAILGSRILVVDNQRLDDLVKYKEACVMRDELDAEGRIVHKWRLMRMSAAASWELYDMMTDTLQKNNLLAHSVNDRHIDEVVAALQAAYEKWWDEISVNAENYTCPIAGSSFESVTCLYGHDWHMDEGLPPWNQTMIAAGMSANGFNTVSFAQAGTYTFDLRRWPVEIEDETTITSGLTTPIRVTASNALSYGVALPVHSARIRIWKGDQVLFDERTNVDPDSDGVTFSVEMPAGPAMVQTWFYDASGKELCGAYYNYVRKQ